ncbi:hypothetical protein FH972_017083 [Carpinus fangiana]|uniref:Uncharacterized protein n=1 Tax=Carpinus fangiana TaxID=176857 RepID=A0A5N6RJ57_9ROSI|nr:hypothetical protein FH972_017083 [Carpinus fangiana]
MEKSDLRSHYQTKSKGQKEKSYICTVVVVRPRQECGGSSSAYSGCGFLVGSRRMALSVRDSASAEARRCTVVRDSASVGWLIVDSSG